MGPYYMGHIKRVIYESLSFGLDEALMDLDEEIGLSRKHVLEANRRLEHVLAREHTSSNDEVEIHLEEINESTVDNNYESSEEFEPCIPDVTFVRRNFYS